MKGENIIVILIIAICLVYAGYRIYKAFSSKEDPCANCQGCALKDKQSSHFFNKSGRSRCVRSTA